MPAKTGLLDACGDTPVEEIEVGIHVVEILGDRHIGAGVELALEELDVLIVVLRLGVNFRVGGHGDAKVVARALAHECNQFVGINQLCAAHPGGHIAAQGHQVLHTQFHVAINHCAHRLLVVATKTEVWRHRQAGAVQGGHHLEGVVPG